MVSDIQLFFLLLLKGILLYSWMPGNQISLLPFPFVEVIFLKLLLLIIYQHSPKIFALFPQPTSLETVHKQFHGKSYFK